jgi:membrane fusion protein, copper/silver efflux system
MDRMRRALIAVAMLGCSSIATKQEPVVDPVPMVEHEVVAEPVYLRALDAYEGVRAKLAADENPAEAAHALGAAAEAAKLGELAGSAHALAKTTSLGEARSVFATVSKHVVALIAANPSLVRGHYVFECPMVKGYNKWVQVSQDMANPYMGKAMLACGGESTWK